MADTNELLLTDIRTFFEKAQSGRFSLPEPEKEPIVLYAFPSPEKQVETLEKGLTLPFGNLLQKMREQRRYRAAELSYALAIKSFITNHEARPNSRPDSNRQTIAIALKFGQRLLEMSKLPQEKIDLLVVDDETNDHQARKINFDELADPLRSAEVLLKDKDIGRRKLLWRCIEPEEKCILDAEREWTGLSIEDKWKREDFGDSAGAIGKEVFAYLTGRSPAEQESEKSSVGGKEPLITKEKKSKYQKYSIGSKDLRKLIEAQTLNLLNSHAGSFDISNEGDMIIRLFLHWGVYDIGIINTYLNAQNLEPVLGDE
jgi:hypothetical protein